MSKPVDDPYALDEGETRPGMPVDPARVLRTLRRSFRWLVVATAVGAVAGVAAAKLTPTKTYEAESVVSYRGTDHSEREVQSMVESITLVQSLREVQGRLKIGGAPSKLAERITLAFDPRYSNLIYIRGKAPTGKSAQALADTLATVFVETQTQRDRARRDEVARKLQMDLEVAQARLAYAREVYDAFRNRYGVMNLSEETAAALEQAIKLRSQAEAAEQSMKAADATAQDLRGRLGKSEPGTPSIVTPGVSPLPVDETPPAESQDALDAARRQLAAAQVRLSPDHPEIKLLSAKVADLERRVAGPIDNSSRGLSTRLSHVQRSQADAQSQFRALSAAATEAETRLRQLGQGEGEAAPLMADLGVADNRMRDLKNRLNLALDEARNAVPPFQIVAMAVEPMMPIESKVKLVAIAGPIVALILALIVVFLRSLRGLKVYTPAEVAYWGNAPVVGATSWPRDPTMLTSLFRELDDCTPYASGLTLILGCHESETALARGVAMLWPAERYAASHEPGSAMTVVDPNVHEHRDETPEKVIIGQAGAANASRGSSGGGAAVVPLQTARAALMRLEPEQLVPPHATPPSDPQVINIAQSWTGPLAGPDLRRASRLADRVLVVVRSGQRSVLDLSNIRTRLGRDHGIGYLVVDLDPAYANLKDRVGEVNDFWRATREVAG